MDKRLYPISRKYFAINIEPIIRGCFSRAGRPHTISDYKVFSAIMYVLRTGISWRDLPKCYGYWHSIYLRFKKGSDRGVWWKILIELQRLKKLNVNIVMSDSTTIKYHRHGGGFKKTSKVGEDQFQE